MIVSNVECHYSQAKVDNKTFSLGDFAYVKVKRASLSWLLYSWLQYPLATFRFLLDTQLFSFESLRFSRMLCTCEKEIDS